MIHASWLLVALIAGGVVGYIYGTATSKPLESALDAARTIGRLEGRQLGRLEGQTAGLTEAVETIAKAVKP